MQLIFVIFLEWHEIVNLNTHGNCGFTVALCGCFHCNLAAEYSSVGNTSPGSC